jgi:hypothetical protein
MVAITSTSSRMSGGSGGAWAEAKSRSTFKRSASLAQKPSTWSRSPSMKTKRLARHASWL